MTAFPPPDLPPGLSVQGLHAHHGRLHVLRGLQFHLAPGEVLSLLGRNGAGRSTLLQTLMGLLPPSAGQIWWHDGQHAYPLHRLPPCRIARSGLGYVPEHRDVFPRLTVAQNLALGEPVRSPWAAWAAWARRRSASSPPPPPPPERWPLERLLTLFPSLATRLHTPAGVLSGGEQQMLALARALRGNPAVLLVDEPTEGLAPRLVEQVGALLRELPRQGVAVLLVEQKLTLALDVAHRCLVLGQGQVVFEGPPQALREAPEVQAEWLAV